MKIKQTKLYRLFDLLNQGFGKYKPQIILLAIAGFFGGLLEGIGINAVIPMFSFLFGGGNSDDFISRLIRDFFDFFHFRFSFRYLLIFVVSLFILRAAVLFFCNYLRAKISAKYEEWTRKNLFSKTLSAKWPFLLVQRLGHLDTLLTTNIQYSSLLLQYVGGAIMVLSALIMYVAVAINISLIITLTTLIFGLLILIVFKPLLSKTRAVASEREFLNKQSSHFINENVLGLKTIKSLFLEKKVINEANRNFENMRRLSIRASIFSVLSDSLIQPITMIFVCAVFAVAYKRPDFNFAVLAAVIYLIQRMFTYVQQLQSYLNSIIWSTPYLEAVLKYEKEAEADVEKSEYDAKFVFERKLDFQNVNFAYDFKIPILKNLNFSIGKGEMVGLIGPSGAGKTTIVDLLLRLFIPDSGKIFLDEKDINKINMRDWRDNIGYVSQDMFLKNDTIANNIRFYDERISDKDIEGAAKMANIYDFIQNCPDKFSTRIGERGLMLSAGQRQRIIIARILARNPKILVLDEATSALDNESETEIQKVIENLKGKITVLAIAHRLSTLNNSDRILVLDQGRIIEQGSPTSLLSKENSYFHRVYNLKNI